MTGQARYVDDLAFPGMLHGITVRSPSPRGLIRAIDFGPEIDWQEFTVVTAADVPGSNRVALILEDQPCLASDRVNHLEEPVVLLAHPDRQQLEARAPLGEDRRRARTARVHDRRGAGARARWCGAWTTCSRPTRSSAAMSKRRSPSAPIVVEGEYETGAQEQLYIEPNGMLAMANPSDGVTVWGSMQCPYYVHKALMTALRAARREDSRRADGDRRRLRRQGRVSRR